MLEHVDLGAQKIPKSEYKAIYDGLIAELVVLQQQARSANIGLVVLLEGWNGAGKGSRISDLLYNLDARSTSVYLTDDIDVAQARLFTNLGYRVSGYYPTMQQFWKALGQKGSITFYDRGWYTASIQRLLFEEYGSTIEKRKHITFKKRDREKHLALIDASLSTAESFERQLVDDGYAVVKLFLHVSKKAQKKRLEKLHGNPETSWRVSDAKLQSTKNYDQARELYDELLTKSDFDFARWTLVNAEDKRTANIEIARALIESLRRALDTASEKASAGVAGVSGSHSAAHDPSMPTAKSEPSRAPHTTRVTVHVEPLAIKPEKGDVSVGGSGGTKGGGVVPMNADTYKKKLKKEQRRFFDLEQKMYLARIPLMVMYEGWDAAGKGGNIKRVAQALDARAYTIYTSAAPTPIELAHPHLWRYWTRLPKAGHVGIYDRSWYGRVLVERVEGFASPSEWGRAYDEINEFEAELEKWGALLIKFWVDVSQDEQLVRFKERELDPTKQWKITDDDWRNREKYPQYKDAFDDMVRLTSTAYAPWIILDSNDKRFARIKALETINDALRERLQEK